MIDKKALVATTPCRNCGQPIVFDDIGCRWTHEGRTKDDGYVYKVECPDFTPPVASP